jgi:hypothetical protein
MSFDISTGKEQIVIKVYDRAEIGSDTVLGECTISTDLLKD